MDKKKTNVKFLKRPSSFKTLFICFVELRNVRNHKVFSVLAMKCSSCHQSRQRYLLLPNDKHFECSALLRRLELNWSSIEKTYQQVSRDTSHLLRVVCCPLKRSLLFNRPAVLGLYLTSRVSPIQKNIFLNLKSDRIR